MFALLLPVKEFARSKQRLSACLSPAERALLARAMFEDVWQTLRFECGQYPLFVISAEPVVIERCRTEAVPCLEETASRSHSESVAEATPWAMTFGASSLLSLPIDTPAVTAEEIATIERLAQSYAVVIVPSADGTGTNALLRTPPDAIAPRFGLDSCAIHAEQARVKGLPHLVQPVAGLAADIDTPEEAAQFLLLAESRGQIGHTATLLKTLSGKLLPPSLPAGPEKSQGVPVCS